VDPQCNKLANVVYFDDAEPVDAQCNKLARVVHFDDAEAVSTAAARQPQTDAASRGVAT